MVQRINVALIGYQFMGRAHSNAYRQMPCFFQTRVIPVMKVLCGRNQSRVRTAASQLGWQEWSTSWEEVVHRPDIHVVDIATPGDSHLPICIAAAKAGKAVLCEKPLANNLAESRKMLDAVRRNQVPHMICHNYRKVPAVTLAHQLISKGTLGKIRHFRGTYLQDWPMDPQFPLLWRFNKRKSGTGALGDLGSHIIDLARFLVGEIRGVSALLETFIKERPLLHSPLKKGRVTVDDASLTLVRFTNGAVGTIEASRFAPGHKNYNCFEINGSQGSLSFNLERLNELKLYLLKDRKSFQGFRDILVTEPFHPYMKWWPPGHVIGYEHTFVHVVYDLMQALSQNHNPTPSFLDGVQNQKVIDAIQHSAKSKKWIQIRPE